MTNRREFLKRLAAACAATGGLGAWSDLQRIAAAASLAPGTPKAAGEDYRALVCIFLFGGNDSNNMVIPTSATEYQQYATGRTPALALGQSTLLPLGVQNTPGRTFALHPGMAGFQGLFNQGKAAIVANAGPLRAPATREQFRARSVPIPPDLYSHSDQQAQWPSSTLISVTGNNLFEVGTTISSFKVSPGNLLGFDFYKDASSTDALSRGITELLAIPSVNLFEGAWNEVIDRSIQNQQILATALATVPPFVTAFPDTALGNQMEMIARLLAVRRALGLKRQVFFASIGGFDTHGDEQRGRQAELLGELSASMAALYDATVELDCADLVTSFTASDFNRTFPSNGRGSDHAWGSHHLVAGGAVKGGRLYGTFPTLVRGGPDDTGSGGMWIPTTAVDQYAATLATWFGVGAGDLGTLFPNLARFPARNLGFMA